MSSVYIHIPFCNNICNYCDFCKMYYNEKLVDSYLDELEKEIKKRYKKEEIKTLYIGGGTPSSLNIKQLKRLFTIIKIFKLSETLEFTFEADVLSLDEEKIKLLKRNSVNRISLGVETINKKYQKIINRVVDKSRIEYIIKLVEKYFTNINLDLLYGFNNESSEELLEDLEFLLKFNVKHLSVYSLILEEHTKLYIDNYQRLDDDSDYLLYKLIEEKLEENAYHHYEIANYAKEGYSSFHNLVYWHNDNYYGFGLSSASYIDDERFTNTRSINNYLKGKYLSSSEEVDIDSKIDYEIMLNLRLEKGIDKNKFYQKYQKEVSDIYDYSSLINKKILIEDANNLYVSKNYRYVLSEVLVEFLENKINS